MMLGLAVVLTVSGTVCLRLAWHWGRQHDPDRQVAARWIGWLLLVAALWPWAVSGGPDRGTVLAIIVVMLTGLALVLFEGWRALRAPSRRRREREPRNDLPVRESRGAALLLQRVWIFLLAGPLALAASLAIGLALWLGLTALGVSESNVLAAGMLAVPVVWSVLVIPATMEGRLVTRSLIVVGPGLAGLFASLALAGAAA